MKKMLLIFNPNSGRRKLISHLYTIIELFSRAEYEVTVYPTKTSGDARGFIQERGAAFDLVVCSGGDGMISEAVNAYMRMEKRPPLGCIPSGTVNDFAASLNLPRSIPEAVRSIIGGTASEIDVGVFGGSFFSYVAAFGQFTGIPYSTDQNAKNILGRTAYFLEGIKQVANVTAIDCVIDIDGEIIRGRFMVGLVTNATSVGGFRVQGGGDAAFNDGLFEAFFIRSPKNLSELSEIIAVLTGAAAASEFVVQRAAKRIELVSDTPCKWTLDGEYGGEHSRVVIENRRRALSIITPPARDVKRRGA